MSLLLSSYARKAFFVPSLTIDSSGLSVPQEAFIAFEPSGSGASNLGAFFWFSIAPVLGAGDGIEILVTQTVAPTGGTFTGTVGTRVEMTETREFKLSKDSVGSATCELLIQLFKAGDSEVLASGVVIMNVEVLV